MRKIRLKQNSSVASFSSRTPPPSSSTSFPAKAPSKNRRPSFLKKRPSTGLLIPTIKVNFEFLLVVRCYKLSLSGRTSSKGEKSGFAAPHPEKPSYSRCHFVAIASNGKCGLYGTVLRSPSGNSQKIPRWTALIIYGSVDRQSYEIKNRLDATDPVSKSKPESSRLVWDVETDRFGKSCQVIYYPANDLHISMRILFSHIDDQFLAAMNTETPLIFDKTITLASGDNNGGLTESGTSASLPASGGSFTEIDSRVEVTDATPTFINAADM